MFLVVNLGILRVSAHEASVSRGYIVSHFPFESFQAVKRLWCRIAVHESRACSSGNRSHPLDKRSIFRMPRDEDAMTTLVTSALYHCT